MNPKLIAAGGALALMLGAAAIAQTTSGGAPVVSNQGTPGSMNTTSGVAPGAGMQPGSRSDATDTVSTTNPDPNGGQTTSSSSGTMSTYSSSGATPSGTTSSGTMSGGTMSGGYDPNASSTTSGGMSGDSGAMMAGERG